MPTTDRAAVGEMLAGLDGSIDVHRARAAARAWSSACRKKRACRCSRTWKAFATPTSTATPISQWREVVLNAKLRRPGVCGATETLLVEQPLAARAAAARQGAARRRLRGARRCGYAEGRPRVKPATGGRLGDRVSRRRSIRAVGRRRRRGGDRAHRPVRHAAHGRDHHGQHRHRGAFPAGGRFGDRLAQRLDAVRRRRGVRLRRRDRHRHGQAARARTRRRRAADELQVRRAGSGQIAPELRGLVILGPGTGVTYCVKWRVCPELPEWREG